MATGVEWGFGFFFLLFLGFYFPAVGQFYGVVAYMIGMFFLLKLIGSFFPFERAE